MHPLSRLPILLALLAFATSAAAETALYETGPSEESAYVRFVNALKKDMAVVSANGSAKISLNTRGNGRISRFYRVKAGAQLSSTIEAGGHKLPVEVVGKPWEYITVAALPDGSAGIKVMLIRETPDDFNAMRASLALFNLDPGCKKANMRGGAKNVAILSDIEPFAVQRRLVNPVKLSAGIACSGQADAHVEVPQLQAGERYSAFLFAPGIQPLIATDSK
jgi:hypothetical protein